MFELRLQDDQDSITSGTRPSISPTQAFSPDPDELRLSLQKTILHPINVFDGQGFLLMTRPLITDLSDQRTFRLYTGGSRFNRILLYTIGSRL